jgi:hypothetical protein
MSSLLTSRSFLMSLLSLSWDCKGVKEEGENGTGEVRMMCREVCGPATNEPTHLPERAVELLVLVLELLERLVAREAAEDLQMGVVR